MERPDLTLWQINISHYAEKARWALDYKRVDHLRRSPPPAAHAAIALWLSRGTSSTLPILRWNGAVLPGSGAIIAALEERFPDPRLYPDDPVQRRRALALEDFFDSELGPHVRLFFWHQLIREPRMLDELAAVVFPERLRGAKRLTGAWTRAFVISRYGVASDAAATLARAKILAGLDRLEAELEAGGGEYLAGDAFCVADLTGACLLNPLVGSPQGALAPGQVPTPEPYREFCEQLRGRPGVDWVLQMFKRHRNRAQPKPGPGS